MGTITKINADSQSSTAKIATCTKCAPFPAFRQLCMSMASVVFAWRGASSESCIDAVEHAPRGIEVRRLGVFAAPIEETQAKAACCAAFESWLGRYSDCFDMVKNQLEEDFPGCIVNAVRGEPRCGAFEVDAPWTQCRTQCCAQDQAACYSARHSRRKKRWSVLDLGWMVARGCRGTVRGYSAGAQCPE